MLEEHWLGLIIDTEACSHQPAGTDKARARVGVRQWLKSLVNVARWLPIESPWREVLRGLGDNIKLWFDSFGADVPDVEEIE